MDIQMSGGALEQWLIRRWADGNPDRARQLLDEIRDRLHVAVASNVLEGAATPRALAAALKRQVDHPGGLERLAERLLEHEAESTW